MSEEGLHPRLLFSTASVDFNTRIVLRSSAGQLPYKEQIRVTNNDSTPISLLFGTPRNCDADVYRWAYTRPQHSTSKQGPDLRFNWNLSCSFSCLICTGLSAFLLDSLHCMRLYAM